jgi:Putative transposase
LEKLENGQVTFRYRHNKTQELRHLNLPAQEFIQRFLQHVLPKGFVKVRTYGLWSAAQQELLATIQAQLDQASAVQPPALAQPQRVTSASAAEPIICPKCKLGHMIFIREIAPERKRPP